MIYLPLISIIQLKFQSNAINYQQQFGLSFFFPRGAEQTPLPKNHTSYKANLYVYTYIFDHKFSCLKFRLLIYCLNIRYYNIGGLVARQSWIYVTLYKKKTLPTSHFTRHGYHITTYKGC